MSGPENLAKKIAEKAQRIDKGRVIIGIDGRCASGKSTLAISLASILDAEIIRMDDFFLQKGQKTPERLSEVGGNIDYERFEEEVIAPLKANLPFSYRPYDCHKEALSEPVLIKGSKYLIIEGSYSLHPRYRDIYDLKVFLSVSPEEQKKRILFRNGEEMAERFFNEWIPKEEAYFSAFDIEKFSDIRLESR